MTASITRRKSFAAAISVVGVVVAAIGVVATIAVLAEDGGTGPVLIRVNAKHGLHLGDLPALVLAAVGVGLTVFGLWFGSRPPR